MSKKMTFEGFLELTQKIHGKKYKYFKSTFVNSHTKMKIKCSIHGVFYQTPRKHVRSKQGCTHCAKKRIGLEKRLSEKEFLERANKIHSNAYDYGLVEYINGRAIIKIICKIHGLFKQKAHAHLKNGCPKCADLETARLSSEKCGKTIITRFKKVHGNRYNYSLVDYKKIKIKVKIICKKHGIFKQTPTNHLAGAGCPQCNQSKGENAIERILKKEKIVYIRQKRFLECKNKRPLPFDFYLPKFKVCIEYDGELHYKPNFGRASFKAVLKNDRIKTKFCIIKGIQLIRVPYTVKNLKKCLLNNIK